jgi:hypothetical protein
MDLSKGALKSAAYLGEPDARGGIDQVAPNEFILKHDYTHVNTQKP